MTVCKDSSATFVVKLVVLYLSVTPNVVVASTGVGNAMNIMDYYILATDCWALVGVGTSGGLQGVLKGLEKLLPIDQRSRIQDKLAFKWNDNQLMMLVARVIKDRQNRGNYIIRSYLRCKLIVPAVLGPSRCDNTLLFLVCLRSLGVSFLLTDECANREQSKFMDQTSADDEMAKRLYEMRQLEYQFEKTTLKLTPDVTVLQGFRAETFWNAFDGEPKPIGTLQDDCPITGGANRNLTRTKLSRKEGPLRQYSDLSPSKQGTLAFSEFPPNKDIKFGVNDYIEVVDRTTLQNDFGISDQIERANKSN